MRIAGLGLGASMLTRVALGCASAAVLALVGLPDAASADFTITEGQPFSGTVVDVGGCSLAGAAIYWGDGTPTSVGVSDGGSGVQGTHTYADERTANGNVSYTCNGIRGSQTAFFQATVQDASVASTGRDVSEIAGQSFTVVVAHVDDANPGGSATDFSAQIAWGDGTTSAGSVTSAAGGGFEVTSTHTYATAGSYTISSSITDVGGMSTTTHSIAAIAAAPPPIPRSYALPVVSGEARSQETLATTNGYWSDFPSGFQYQWLRCATTTGGNCVVVADATTSTYTAVQADVGMTMRARVRASNGAGTSLPADSAPTTVVQPFVIRARFTISPNPTCTGLPVTFDASSSKTPNPPITRYQFSYTIVDDPFWVALGGSYPTPPGGYFADSANPRATEVFGFDVDAHPLAPKVFPAGTYFADPRVVTLRVTDGTGASASYTQQVDFAQSISNLSRADCPKLHAHAKAAHFAVHSIKLNITKTSVTAKVPCSRFADCAGTLRLLERSGPSQLRVNSGRIASSARPVVIASSKFFFVPAHRARTISETLTRAGRALIHRAKPLTAIAQLTTVSPTGPTTTQSFTVTLIGKKKRR